MKIKIVAFVLVLALVMSVGVVFAQKGRMGKAGPATGGGWCMGLGMLDKISKELSLTNDQVSKIKAIQSDFMSSTQTARTEIQAKMKQMGELWMESQPDAAAIKSLASELDTLRMQVRNSAIDHAISAIEVLTADQRVKLQEMMKSRPGMCMGMGCGLCCGAGMGTGTGPGAGGPNCPYTK